MSELIDNEEYLTIVEAAKFVGYSREWFRNKIAPDNHLTVYQKGVRKIPLYKKTELEPLVRIRQVDHNGHKPE